MKYYFITLMLFGTLQTMCAQQLEHVAHIASFVASTAMTPTGECYALVNFRDSTSIFLGNDSLQLKSSASGVSYKYATALFKFSNEGNLEWHILLDDTLGSESGMAICLRPNGNVLVAGVSDGPQLDIDPGPDTVFLRFNRAGLSERRQLFFAEYDSQGTLAWGHAYTQMDSIWVAPKGLAIDINGNILVTGRFEGTVDFDPNRPEWLLRGHTFYGNDFLARYSPTGALKWVYTHGGYARQGIQLAPDQDGSILMVGNSRSTVVDLDFGRDTLWTTSSFVFVARYDSMGNLLMGKGFEGGPGLDKVSALALGPDRSIFVAGEFRDKFDADPGPDTVNYTGWRESDGFLVKLDSAGNYQWSYVISGRDVGGAGDGIRAIYPRDNGEVYIGGEFAEKTDFDPGPGVVTKYVERKLDLFWARLGPQGELRELHSMQNLASPHLRDIYVKENGHVVAVGNFDNYPITLDSLNGVILQVKQLWTNTFLAEFSPGVSTGIQPGRPQPAFRFYPNPASKTLHIERIHGAGQPPVNVKLCTIQGKVIRTYQLSSASEQIRLPDGLTPGVFGLQISHAEGTIFRKLLIVD